MARYWHPPGRLVGRSCSLSLRSYTIFVCVCLSDCCPSRRLFLVSLGHNCRSIPVPLSLSLGVQVWGLFCSGRYGNWPTFDRPALPSAAASASVDLISRPGFQFMHSMPEGYYQYFDEILLEYVLNKFVLFCILMCCGWSWPIGSSGMSGTRCSEVWILKRV